MANKINRTDIYPNTTPANGDYVLGVDVSNTTNDENGEVVTFKISAILGKQHNHSLSDIPDAGTAAAASTDDFATPEQGAKADSAQQPPAEGAFVDGDKTKLDGIEAAADVTDTANVTAAGALMDSEVTNLAAVKAFDPTDYATAAQGSTADSALQPGDIGSTVQAFDADTLKADVHNTLAAGFDGTPETLGTITSGTVTPEVDGDAKSNFKSLTNNGAFTLAPPSTSSDCTIRIHVINAASAGAITTTGFDKVFDPDTYATTNAKEYFFYIDHTATRDVLTIREIV
jgi:hypothetical protein